MWAQVEYSTDGGPSGGSSGCLWEVIDGPSWVPNLGTATWPMEFDGQAFHLCGSRAPFFTRSALWHSLRLVLG